MHPDLAHREVPLRKIIDYLLNDRHPVGRAKAEYFRRLGFDSRRPGELQAALYDHAARHPVVDVAITAFGTKLVVRGALATPDGRDPQIVSVWMTTTNGPARMLTAYPDR